MQPGASSPNTVHDLVWIDMYREVTPGLTRSQTLKYISWREEKRKT